MTTFFRTPQGSHRHTTWTCARSHQPIGAPEPVVVPAGQVKDWTPCAECCTAEDVQSSAQAALVSGKCPNSGLVPANPRKLYRRCRDCGYEGKVGASGLRAHKPQK